MRIPTILSALTVMAMASVAMAGFAELRDRDVQRFTSKEVKPFRQDKDVAVIVMREGIPRGGGYTYQYPRENPAPFMTDIAGSKQGDLAMEVELIASDYSGVAICIAGSSDLTPYLDDGELAFWIKGAKGGEKAQFVLIDDGVKSNGESYQVKLGSVSFGELTTDWKLFRIPLKTFGSAGVYWDEKNMREVAGTFAWSNFKGFRVEVRKDDNTSFKVWIDDVVINKVGPAYEGPSNYPFRNEI